MTWLIFGLFFLSVMFVVLAFARPQSTEDASARLDYLKERQGFDENTGENLPKLSEKSREQLAPIASKLLPSGLQKSLRQKLDHSGMYEVSVAHYAVNSLILMFLAPIGFYALNLFLLHYENNVLIYALPGLAALGYYYPLIRLNSMLDTRRRNVFRALPDLIDLLTICLEAGMGLDAALNLVVRKGQDGPLKDELERTLKEIRVGKTRAQAMKDMAKRLDMKEVTSFVVAVVQAEQIGGNLSNTLKVQSEIARESRWQKAQELAQKAPVKMLFPMLFLIFPNIFLMIFGPILLGFMLGRL